MANEVCPKAMSLDEKLQLRGALDMCAPHAWNEVEGITDSGFGFETEAANVSAEAEDCLKRLVSKKADIERIWH